MSRYDIPDPKCKHAGMKTRISSHDDLTTAEGASASIWVCDREVCIQDAKEWIWAKTHREAVVVTKTNPANLHLNL